MPDYNLTAKEHCLALRAALVIDAAREALDALTGLAQHCAAHGQDQQAANLLAFVLGHPDVRYDTFDYAEDLFLDLEARVCPRVIADARQFALGKTLRSVADYACALASGE
ncbi:MAG: hypothetical protein BroJett033_3330 [Chloroflexota bacterium]|nr:MAG: hypothetical protein BroJett033_3330 [Chloroflexota bacterium]